MTTGARCRCRRGERGSFGSCAPFKVFPSASGLALAQVSELRYPLNNDAGVEQIMPLERAEQPKASLDRFGQRYRLWFVIPLIIAAATAVWSRTAALGFMIFMMSFWVFVGGIALILRLTQHLLPTSLSPENKAEIQQSVGFTLFLVGCALAGVVLRGENAVSEFVENTTPKGFAVGFIDPTFALVCIVGAWLYTAYRIRK